MPTFLSLFAGVGGFDLGLERAGFRCVGQVEIDPFCQRVLERRWPGVERVRDVLSVAREYQRERDGSEARKVTAEWSKSYLPVDLLTAGFPCQDLSVAGKRAGLAGERSGLFWEIIRIAKAIRPAWGLFENVPGLVSSHAGRDLWTVLQGLRECWPAVGYRILDSRYFGVAQRRRRVFFVCGPTEAGVAKVLALFEGGAGDSAASGEAGADVARCIATGTNGSRYDGETETFVTAETLTAGSNPNSNMAGRRREDDVNIIAFDPTAGLDIRAYNDGTTPGLKVGTGPQVDLGWAPAIAQTHALTGEGHDASEDGTGARAHPPALAEASSVRRLTPMECERLQGFPDGWTCLCTPLHVYADDPDTAALACTCPDSPRYRALGNAVTTTVIAWLGRRLMERL